MFLLLFRVFVDFNCLPAPKLGGTAAFGGKMELLGQNADFHRK
jgi:hypothetical protein